MLHKLLFLLVFFFVFPARSALVDRIMAIINDDIITLSDIQEFKKNVPTSELPSDKAILDILIEDRLTKQLIKKLNLAADEEEISSQISSILKNQGLTQKDLQDFLKQRGMSYKQYRDNIKQSIEQQKLLEREIKSSITIKEEDIRSYYYTFVKGKSLKKSYHLRQIFFPAETASDKKKKMALAQEAYTDYKNGSSFEALLNKYSTSLDPSTKENKGDAGTPNEEDLSPSFKNVLSNLKPKTLSAPFETGAGIHLIELLEIHSQGEKSYSETKEEIQKMLYEKEFKKILAQWIKTKKEEAYIKILKNNLK